MAYRKHPFAVTIAANPKEAAATIVQLYRQEAANQKAVADRLQCSEGTVIRWIKVLDAAGMRLTPQLAKIKREAERDGWHHGRNRLGGRRPPASQAP